MQIKQDVFPAFALIAPASSGLAIEEMRSAPPTSHPDAHQIITCRVVVSADRIIIARDGSTGPVVVFNQPYTLGNHGRSADSTVDSWVITDNGTRVVFRKDANCGCGSRLRSWAPYGIADSVRDPSS